MPLSQRTHCMMPSRGLGGLWTSPRRPSGRLMKLQLASRRGQDFCHACTYRSPPETRWPLRDMWAESPHNLCPNPRHGPFGRDLRTGESRCPVGHLGSSRSGGAALVQAGVGACGLSRLSARIPASISRFRFDEPRSRSRDEPPRGEAERIRISAGRAYLARREFQPWVS